MKEPRATVGRSVRRRILSATTVVLLPVVALAIALLVALSTTNSNLDRVVRTNHDEIVPVIELKSALFSAQTIAFFVVNDPTLIGQFKTVEAEIEESFAELVQGRQSEAGELLLQAEADWVDAIEIASPVHDRVVRGEMGSEAYPAPVPFATKIDVAVARLDEFAENALGRADAAVTDLNQLMDRLFLAMFVCVGFTLLVILRANRWLVRSLARPVADLRDAAEQLGSGSLDARVEIDTGDELELLGNAFNSMATRIEEGQLDLEHRAYHDSLTGLGNRNMLLEKFEEIRLSALADGSEVDAAVLLADLDNFKQVNDVAGHLAGDHVLIEVARRLETCLRRNDIAVRLGGDEFAVLLHDLDDDDVPAQISNRLIDALREPFVVSGQEFMLGWSIGIASITGGESATDLLRQADLAMYTAKSRGKQTFAFFEQSMQTKVTDRAKLEGDLRHGLDSELITYFQPIVSLADGRVEGAEALVRWDHPQRGLMLPGEFIPLAESTGLVVPLGWIVLEDSIRELAEWRRVHGDSAPSYVSVNMSTVALRSRAVIDQVKETLDRHGLAPSCLMLEITETELLRDGQMTHGVLEDLRGIGVRVAIDDFGTGFSSLAYLAQFPVDVLKIDRAFVAGLSISDGKDLSSSNNALSSAIVAIGAALGLETVAEGVERQEQAEILVRIGCKSAQGFHLARPMSASAMQTFVADRAASLATGA